MTTFHLIDDSYLARHRLLAGNTQSTVAVCALWKDLSRVKFSTEDLGRLSLVGNLYTARGISVLLRGLWRAPSIRHLALWGPDTQHTGRDLIKLWNEGFDASHRIIGTEVGLDKNVPDSAIERLRRHVYIHDWREHRSVQALMGQVARLDPLPPHGEAQVFPESEPDVPDTMPSGGTGWHITAPKIAMGWTRALALIMHFGQVKRSQYNIGQREALNLLTVIFDENPDNPYLPEYLPLTETSLTEYAPRILEDFPADDLSYTYGNRLHGYFGRDQESAMIQQLAAAPYSRRAIATMWDPQSDPERDTPPCLTQIVMNIVDGRLYLTYSARSQDMFAAWPQNTFAMRLLQRRAAETLGVKLGPTTSHTVSAHIYEHDWAQVQTIVDSRQAADRTVEFDPHGNFAIRLENRVIVVELQDPDGKGIIWQTHGTSSAEIGKEIASLRLASLPTHYVYLGRELQRAEDALRRNELYDQGMA